MGNRYVVDIDLTPTGGNDVVTIVSPANRRVRPVQIAITGNGTTSAAQRLLLARSTGGTTGGGAITPNKADHIEQPTAAATVNTTWSGQPTIESNGVMLGWNALGGAIVYNVPKGAFEARNGENVSIRAVSGPTYQACSVSVIYEED
jgi:hypothetical protein